MILVCPSCKASYLVPANLFLSGARKVRCARCGKDWAADLPSRMTAVPTSTAKTTQKLPQEPEIPSFSAPSSDEPVSPASNLPALWKAPKEKLLKIAKLVALVVAVCSFLGLAALTARPLYRLLHNTFSAPVAEEAHPFEPVIAPGFSMQRVRSERRYQDGSMQLAVDGELYFDGEAPTPTPDIHVAALGPDGKKIIEWTIKAPVKTMKKSDNVPFSSSINTPEGTIVEINLTFIPQPQQHEP